MESHLVIHVRNQLSSIEAKEIYSMAAWETKWTLLQATYITLQMFFYSSLIAGVIAVIFGIFATSRYRILRIVATVYSETFRGISLVVQLFWLYFVLPLFGLSISAMPAAIAALALCFGAYGVEIVRSSIQSVKKGQSDAAAALGLRGVQRFVLIVAPQALLIALPNVGNLLILILKGTSVTALITIPELTFTVSSLNNNYGLSLSIITYVVSVYYIFAKLIIYFIRMTERRLAHIS